MKKMKLNIQLFGHTNSTQNYNLPQFIGSDKPTWLGDVNTAMSTIDTAMGTNASNISSLGTRVTSAEGIASQASTDVAGLTSTVNTLSDNVTTVTTTANNAQSTATSALNTANSASDKADSATSAITALTPRVTACENSISNFNLTTYGESNVTKSTGTYDVESGAKLYYATNSDGSLAKIYGQVTVGNITNGGIAKISTPLRPESDITINGGCNHIVYTFSGSNLALKRWGNTSYTIKTNGDVEFNVYKIANGDSQRFTFINSLIFVKDFGDTPVTPE